MVYPLPRREKLGDLTSNYKLIVKNSVSLIKFVVPPLWSPLWVLWKFPLFLRHLQCKFDTFPYYFFYTPSRIVDEKQHELPFGIKFPSSLRGHIHDCDKVKIINHTRWKFGLKIAPERTGFSTHDTTHKLITQSTNSKSGARWNEII